MCNYALFQSMFVVFVVATAVEWDLGRSSAIPELLLNCYRNDGIEKLLEVPHTPRLLIELLGKFERNQSDASLKEISNMLLHQVKFDGVQRIFVRAYEVEIPFRAAGKQFYKYKLLVDHFIGKPSRPFPNLGDGNITLCLLHLLLSNTFENPRLKPDFVRGNVLEQRGVMQTKWGTVSPGFIVAAIACALQREHIMLRKLMDGSSLHKRPGQHDKQRPLASSLEKPVDSVSVATLGGVLAETILNQAAHDLRMTAPGSWNDTLLPLRYHFRDHFWDSNNAILLGAIDALIISDNLFAAFQTYPQVRLSQLLDMYYSRRGLFSDPAKKACNRKAKLKEAIGGIRLDAEEISAITKLLEMAGYYGTTWTDGSVINELSERALLKFEGESVGLISSSENCSPDQTRSTSMPRLEVVLIVDQFYDVFRFKRFLTILSEEADVSWFGSKMGIVNGHDGTWLCNVTDQLITLFGCVERAKRHWPLRLSLAKSFRTLVDYYQSKTLVDDEAVLGRPRTQTVVVLSETTYLSDVDKENAMGLMRTIVQGHPETRFVFAAPQQANDFSVFARSHPGNCALLTVGKEVRNAAKAIGTTLRRIPISIINIYRRNRRSSYEDYLANGQRTIYEVHAGYNTVWADVSVKFKGFGYGDLVICAFDDSRMLDGTDRIDGMDGQQPRCKQITDNDEVTFYARDQCEQQPVGCSAQFAVLPKNSVRRCTEYDCQYPDQIRLQVSAFWNGAYARKKTMWHLALSTTLLLNVSARLSSP